MLAIWVVTAPFGVMALVSSSYAVNRMLSRFHRVMLPLGWFALLTVVANVIVLGEARSELALWVAAPLAGLSIWVRGRGDDDDGGSPPPEPEPSGGPSRALRYSQPRHRVLPPSRPRGHPGPRKRTPARVR